MSLTFCSLFSGSSGNATYIASGKTGILIDAGLSGRQITDALSRIGVLPETLSGIIITHEHTDHVKGAGILSRKYHLPLYANEGTWAAMARQVGTVAPAERRVFETDSDFYIGDLSVHAFAIPHDAADPVGFRVYAGGCSVATATDMGCIRKSVMNALSGTDLVLLESNHDPAMLMRNEHYSAALKRRILGEHGHLSNEACSKGILTLYESGVRRLVLGHLSAENNTPELALDTALEAVTREGLTPDEDIFLDLGWRDRPGKLYQIG